MTHPTSEHPPPGATAGTAQAWQPTPAADDAAPPNPMVDDDAWFGMHDSEKVAYTESTLGEILAFLDARLTEIDELRIEVEDPEGYIRFTVGPDGRMLSLLIHDSARTQLTNLEFEQKFSTMLTVADESVAAARSEITNTSLHYSPPAKRQC